MWFSTFPYTVLLHGTIDMDIFHKILGDIFYMTHMYFIEALQMNAQWTAENIANMYLYAPYKTEYRAEQASEVTVQIKWHNSLSTCLV
jgi:hypothetical protein